MSYNYSKLLGRIVEKYGTQYNFSIAMGMSERSLSLKLNNRVPWKDKEIDLAMELLDLPLSELQPYFFEKKVHVT